MEPDAPTALPMTDWSRCCLRRFRRLLALTPAAAPSDLTPLEALALLEWTRMAVYADCHAAGAGGIARAMLRRSLRRSPSG